jgi:NhaP-type Na+/H+ or K+/H+ antiporter
MYSNPQVPSLARRIGVSLLIGLAIALTGSILESLIDRHQFLSLESVDDILVGVLAAGIVFAYEQRRYRAILDKVLVIAAMNHHVRNALQAISYVPYAQQEKQIKMIQDSVKRIEWALREILPGEAENGESAATPHANTPETKDEGVLPRTGPN